MDRGFEYEIETLARLFRVSSNLVERSLKRIVSLMPTLTLEDESLDRWIGEQHFTPNARPWIPAREELARYAYRVLQGTWYSRRTADTAYLQLEGIPYLERREFDPWLPTLFTHEAALPFEPLAGDDQTGSEWFNADLSDFTSYITGEEFFTVHEYLHKGDADWRLVSSIESCVISPGLADDWLAFEGNLTAPHADFPNAIYVREVNDNHDDWWAQWSYGVILEPGVVCDVAYAVGRLSVEEPFYVQVSRPAPRFGQGLDLERRPWGYQFTSQETRATVWVNHCPGNNQVRVLAARRWTLETLARNDLLWAFDLRITKERREEAQRGYSLVAGPVGSLVQESR